MLQRNISRSLVYNAVLRYQNKYSFQGKIIVNKYTENGRFITVVYTIKKRYYVIITTY